MTVNMLTQSKKRIFEKEKEEYTKRTLVSIIKSINHAKIKFKETKFKIYVIDHNSRNDQMNMLKNILNNSQIEVATSISLLATIAAAGLFLAISSAKVGPVSIESDML